MGRILKPGTCIAHCTIEEMLGSGGEGAVYRVTTDGGDVQVLKQHNKGVGGSTVIPEIERARRLECLVGEAHPRVAELYEIFEHDGLLYISMEFVPGRSLEQKLIEDGPFFPEVGAILLIHILEGLAWLHERGIVHRDIKPANIMIVENPDGTYSAKIIDTGIALHTAMPRLTKAEIGPGTPEYAPVEVITASDSIDARADIYSVGAVMFELLSGEPAFIAPRGPELFRLIAAPSRPSLREVDPDAPLCLDQFVRRLMAVRADDRPRDVAQALDEFQEVLEELGITVKRESIPAAVPSTPPRVSPLPPPSRPSLSSPPPPPRPKSPAIHPRPIASSAPPKRKIEILSGTMSGIYIDIPRKGVTLGRNTLNPDDGALSRIHFRAVLRREGVHVRDLGSRNRILTGGRRLKKALIRPGEEFTVGKTVLRYV